MKWRQKMSVGIALGTILTFGYFFSLAAAAQELRQHTLANGLRIILVENHWHSLVALEVCYGVGARNDPAGKQGLAHLLEHLTYQSLRSPHADEAILTERPRWARATTNHDTTCYSSQLLSAEIRKALAAEADRMATLDVSVKSLEHEKAIIIKERRQLVEGDTWRNLLEEVDGVAFRVHPYRFPTSGWPETLAQISLGDVHTHFTAYYSPANAVLVAVGSFHDQELLALIKDLFGQIPARPLPALPALVEPAQGSERHLLLAPLAAPRIVVAYHVPAFGSQDTAALEVVSALLVGGDQTRLPALLYPHKLAEDVGIEYSPLTSGPNLFYIKVALGPQVDFRLAGEALDDALWHLREDDLNPGELEQAKKRRLLDSYLDHSLRTQAAQLAQYGILSSLAHAQRYTDAIRAVTAADVQRVIKAYLSPENRVVGMTGVGHQAGGHRRKGAAQ